MSELSLRNRQKTCAVDTRFLKRVTQAALREMLEGVDYELGIQLVEPDEMAEVNQKYLDHEGSTDVITFDHSEGLPAGWLYGELYICPADAVKQAKQFRTNWQSELTRYIVHGILHLQGFDDIDPNDRVAMKKEENRFVKLLSQRFDLRAVDKGVSLRQ